MTLTSFSRYPVIFVAVLFVFPTAAKSQTSVGSNVAHETAITPFKIQVPEEVLLDLKERLTHARFADELPDANWDYGTSLTYLKRLVEYWRSDYDWRAQEKRLNAFDQFQTKIDGVAVHFIHQRSKNSNAIPLLLLNGWPSSIVEYQKVIAALADPVAFGGKVEDSFHVIIPSMPGFGFSGKPTGRGYHPERIARMWMELMARLGYTRYAISGSDWGNLVITRMGLADAAHVIAVHALSGPRPIIASTDAAAADSTINSRVDEAHNKGYQEIQSTKPQTLGHALSDSPVGLASWIIEKWFAWADHDGDLENVVTKDELLTNIMIYWVTNSGASSARIYYENRHMSGSIAPTFNESVGANPAVPKRSFFSASQYDKRGPRKTPSAAVLSGGGHFPAIEQPTFWINDVRAFLGEYR
jgi:epoxide hydrolase